MLSKICNLPFWKPENNTVNSMVWWSLCCSIYRFLCCVVCNCVHICLCIAMAINFYCVWMTLLYLSPLFQTHSTTSVNNKRTILSCNFLPSIVKITGVKIQFCFMWDQKKNNLNCWKLISIWFTNIIKCHSLLIVVKV